MEVRVVREPLAGGATRYLVEVNRTGHIATVTSFDQTDGPDPEARARACAIRLAASLGCRAARSC